MLVCDYISKYVSDRGVSHVFGVTGGFAMFMNNSFGSNQNLKNIYTHSEQGASYAAIGMAKVTNSPVIVSTTAGVAALNAVSGLLVAWQESLPILYISGQVNTKETIRHLGNDIRHYSGQDCDIVEVVKKITKYSAEVHDPQSIKFHLDRMFYEMSSGRAGPCWLSVPLDVQNSTVDIETLSSFEDATIPSYDLKVDSVLELLAQAKRPLILAGNGIKLSGGCDVFNTFIEKFKIPIVASYNGIDVASSDSPLYIGRCGINGDRSGNFALQNCDLLISMGCRLALGVIGYNAWQFSRESKKIMIDIDKRELDKDVIHVDLKIWANIKEVIVGCLSGPVTVTDPSWLAQCESWKAKWFRQLPPLNPELMDVNPYYFYHDLCNVFSDSTCIVSSSGTIHTPMVHCFKNTKKIHFVMNSATGDMGSELPATIGIYLSKLYKHVIGLIGDGSMMFNIQELETIQYNKLPVKIIVMNNGGYESIRVSQRNYFGNSYGTDENSGLSFPNFRDVAHTFKFEYLLYDNDIQKLKQVLDDTTHPTIIEVRCHGQDRYPKLSSSKNAAGQIVSKPLEDMFPFLDRDEFNSNMIVKVLET